MQEPLERAYFAEVVEPQLGGSVEFLGEVGHDQKVELLGDALCLLNPVAWPEPFGMVMVEALACGTPVVGTPAGATTEIVEDGVTGYICSTDAEFHAALHQVDRLERAKCRQAAQDRFSALRMARDHIRVFEQVLRARAGTGAPA
jgi:glycosyltransferase involved in cell wall biosynthesis